MSPSVPGSPVLRLPHAPCPQRRPPARPRGPAGCRAARVRGEHTASGAIAVRVLRRVTVAEALSCVTLKRLLSGDAGTRGTVAARPSQEQVWPPVYFLANFVCPSILSGDLCERPELAPTEVLALGHLLRAAESGVAPGRAAPAGQAPVIDVTRCHSHSGLQLRELRDPWGSCLLNPSWGLGCRRCSDTAGAKGWRGHTRPGGDEVKRRPRSGRLAVAGGLDALS